MWRTTSTPTQWKTNRVAMLRRTPYHLLDAGREVMWPGWRLGELVAELSLLVSCCRWLLLLALLLLQYIARSTILWHSSPDYSLKRSLYLSSGFSTSNPDLSLFFFFLISFSILSLPPFISIPHACYSSVFGSAQTWSQKHVSEVKYWPNNQN